MELAKFKSGLHISRCVPRHPFDSQSLDVDVVSSLVDGMQWPTPLTHACWTDRPVRLLWWCCYPAGYVRWGDTCHAAVGSAVVRQISGVLLTDLLRCSAQSDSAESTWTRMLSWRSVGASYASSRAGCHKNDVVNVPARGLPWVGDFGQLHAWRRAQRRRQGAHVSAHHGGRVWI